MRFTKRRHEPGFTLIELMVALVLLSIGLFSVIQLQVVTVRGGAFARERSEAQALANAVAEEMRARALNWVDNQVLADFDLQADVFGGEWLEPRRLVRIDFRNQLMLDLILAPVGIPQVQLPAAIFL